MQCYTPYSANWLQHPTVINTKSCNTTDNITVTIKCVRNKFCASTTQLVATHHTAVEANYSVCYAEDPMSASTLVF